MGLVVFIVVAVLALLGMGIGLWLALRRSRGGRESVHVAVDAMTDSAREVEEAARRSRSSRRDEN